MRKITTVLAMIIVVLMGATLAAPASAGTAPPPVPIITPEIAIDVPDAEPAGSVGYHIRNSSLSANEVWIYKTSDCSGSYPNEWALSPGEQAQSTQWIAMSLWSDRHYFEVTVYRGSDGAYLAGPRKYPWYACVKAYTTNDYFVRVKPV